jgi:hypothetical protein
MKKIAILATLALSSVVAAHAEINTRQLAYELRNNQDTYLTGFLAGVVLGDMRDPQVCAGSTVVGAAQEQVAADLDKWADAYPAKAVEPMSLSDASTVILSLMKVEYPCK